MTNNNDSIKNIPTIFTVLGATGDLAERKIFPSLYTLFTKNKLPKLIQILGFSRRPWDEEKFRKYVSEIIEKKGLGRNKLDSFLQKVSYHGGNFEEVHDFKIFSQRLGKIDGSWQVCTNKLFYIAAPPDYYEMIFNNLSVSGLTEPCSPEEGWTRVIVEKPFGKDLKTAVRLDELLGKLFREEQIFRIDHYLGKEALQNILAFRFSNSIFEQSWNNKYIDSIEVKLLETEGVEGRGAFYDGLGALRDVGQNHLLQMLALTTMDNPASYGAEAIRAKREELLSNLKTMDPVQIKNETFRAQYIGYQNVSEVADASNTETYFKANAYLDSPRWRGVRITLESGKAMSEQKKEVLVRFKHPSPCFCPPGSDHKARNKVIFAVEPNEEITFRLWYKKPGYDLEMEKRSFDLPYRKSEGKFRYTEEYESLLLDCFSGDQTSFITSGEMKSMWEYTDPIVSSWDKHEVQLHTYQIGEEDIRIQADEAISIKPAKSLDREIGIVGLGKMGSALAENLLEKSWRVVGFNRSPEKAEVLKQRGLEVGYSPRELVGKLKHPRVVWLMVYAGETLTSAINNLSSELEEGDTVIDGGNTHFEDSIKHSEILKKKGIEFVDVGVSGGPQGARYGASLMVGGKRKHYDKLLRLYVDLAVPGGHEHFEGIGAGHFVKMVHNAIEYGMMQSIAEGFDVLRSSEYTLHLKNVASVYNNGSVIESRLMSWMMEAFEIYGDDLKKVSGKAGSGGASGMQESEAKWTLDVAKKIGIPLEVVEESIRTRVKSQKQPGFQGRVINALRNRFGGHNIE